ncbi:lariat debranching enzyme [Dispira simplex]|nr:lariat debranching enzyme [Dispira simplex]
MLVAIEGCGHGELENIYAAVARRSKNLNRDIDLVIICGDFQAVRNTCDLQSLACPAKYRKFDTFHEYYSGKRHAPYPTIFIGGNHEASNYLTELYMGGWVCPNIYYLGNAGVIRFNGLRIGGLSGIYNARDYTKGHFERPPYDRSTLRSVYHARFYDVLKLMQIQQPLDVFITHDWPQGIEQFGNTAQLLKRKPYFREEVKRNDLGSSVNWMLLQHLQPNHWFSAHLHVRFTATVHHPPDLPRSQALRGYLSDTSVVEPTESGDSVVKPDIDHSEQINVSPPGTNDDAENQSRVKRPRVDTSSPEPTAPAETIPESSTSSPVPDPAFPGEQQPPSPSANVREWPQLVSPTHYTGVTQFLALDKCLPRREFLEIVEFTDSPSLVQRLKVHSTQSEQDTVEPLFEYDPEWLAITRALQSYLPVKVNDDQRYPSPEELKRQVDTEMEWVHNSFFKNNTDPFPLRIPANFAMTAPLDEPHTYTKQARGRVNATPIPPEYFRQPPGPPYLYNNPQTETLCARLQIPNMIQAVRPLLNIPKKL